MRAPTDTGDSFRYCGPTTPSQPSSQHCPEYNALLDVHQDLCNALPINDLFPGLITRRVMDVFDKEKLCLGKIERESAELFVEKYLHPQLLVGDTKRFNDFIATMEESPKCSFLLKKVKDRIIAHQNEATLAKNAGVNDAIPVDRGHTVYQKKNGVQNYFVLILLIIVCVCLLINQILMTMKIALIQSQVDSCCMATKPVCKPEDAVYHLQDTSFQLLPKTTSDQITAGVVPLIVVMNISNISEILADKEEWQSKPFFAFERGYLLYLSVFPGGHGDGEGTHLSVFLHLIKGPYDDELQQAGYWPMRGMFTIDLVNVYDSSKNHFHGYHLLLHYLLCEPCTFRVIEGDSASGYGYPQFLSHIDLLSANVKNSLIFRISYKNHHHYENIITDKVLKERLSMMMEFFFKELIGFSFIYLLCPFVLDYFFNYDSIFFFQTVYPLSSILKDTAKFMLVIEFLIAADAVLIVLIGCVGIEDNVSAPFHATIIRLLVISLFDYLVNYVVSFLKFFLFLNSSL